MLGLLDQPHRHDLPWYYVILYGMSGYVLVVEEEEEPEPRGEFVMRPTGPGGALQAWYE